MNTEAIEAAYIQGWFALGGTLFGAIALIVSIWLGAKFTLSAHTADKLAEAKRDLYLELIHNWHNFLITVNSFRLESEKDFKNNLILSMQNTLACLHKSSFISESKTKEELMRFTFKYTEVLFEIQKLTIPWYQSNELDKKNIEIQLLEVTEVIALDAMEIEKLLRVELGILNDTTVDNRISIMQQDYAEKIKKKMKEDF